MLQNVLVSNLKKKFGKCLTLTSYYVIEKSKNGFALMASNPAMLYTAGKSVKNTSIGTKIMKIG
jgi:hypothetical protein